MSVRSIPRNTKNVWKTLISIWPSCHGPHHCRRATSSAANWGSESADAPGSRNLPGIKNKIVDELIEELVRAPSRPSLVAHTHALDRVLQYGYYVIPHYHTGVIRIAYWDKYRHPAISPKYLTVSYDGGNFDTWWFDPGAAQALEAKTGDATKQ